MTIQLNNGRTIPNRGFGAMIYDGREAEQAVTEALEAGYRLIDTAEVYRNEEAVGRAIRKSSVPREDIVLTTKLWPSQTTRATDVKRQFADSLKRLGLDYVDLYLVHEPYGNILEIWSAMEDLVRSGQVRMIGVSNFDEEQLKTILDKCAIKPLVNQIESHPWFNQNDLVSYCLEQDVIPQSWSSLAEGKRGIFRNPVLLELADKYGKSVAQVILRWEMDRGLIPLAKSSTASRIKENFAITDFELSPEDIQAINDLNTGQSLYPHY